MHLCRIDDRAIIEAWAPLCPVNSSTRTLVLGLVMSTGLFPNVLRRDGKRCQVFVWRRLVTPMKCSVSLEKRVLWRISSSASLACLHKPRALLSRQRIVRRKHQWFKGRILASQASDPSSSLGWCISFAIFDAFFVFVNQPMTKSFSELRRQDEHAVIFSIDLSSSF